MAYQFHYTPTGTGVISGKEVLEQTEDAINDLSGQISGDVQIAIDTANNALNTANTASVDAQNAINTANTAYTAATNAQNTANAAQNTASNALTAAQNAQNDVNALGNRVTTAEGNITQNTNAITGLTTRMGTAEGNIGNLQTAVSTAQATANSAQQTATTARQQAYVLRYSSTAITDNSTIAYSTLDNTDNIKADDKIIDVDGKIFSVVSVDSDNSTVTVGTALIDLLSSSDVGAVALSNNYNDLDNLPTIPTVNDAVLTIQKNGLDVQTFTANASSDVTCNITVPTKTSELTNDSGFLTSADTLPIGSYIQFAGSQAPAGFLVCNGGAISRTTYSALFAVIGTTYGSGDGSTTFNLPNLTDRFLQGSTTSGTVKDAGLPEIYGYFGGRFVDTPDGANVITTRFGAFRGGGGTGEFNGIPSEEPAMDSQGTDFFASGSNSIYGNSTTVQPPALTCLICIKY